MEEKLILCVSEFPELYITSLLSCQDLGRKALSWKHVSNQMCLCCWQQQNDVILLEDLKTLPILLCPPKLPPNTDAHGTQWQAQLKSHCV